MAHILLIDDDERLRGMLRMLLVKLGHEVSEAGTGKEGIAAYTGGGVDLVITDVVMPDKEGLETIMELRRKHGAKKIIAMSGGGYMAPSDYLRTALQMGATRAIAKPFSHDAMITLVNEVLALA